MITIRKARLKDYSTLMTLTVSDEQKPFVSSFGELYKKRSNEHEFYVINQGKEILGFFMLDKAYANRYTFADKKDLGIRNLIIDSAHQGKGYGTAALKRLIPYLYGAYPDFNSVCLTVNKKNRGAYRCYEKAGFFDTGDIYYGGDAGPQHIMRKRIG